MQQDQEPQDSEQARQVALADLSTKAKAAVFMLSSNSVLGVNRLHRKDRARTDMMAPVQLHEMIDEGDFNQPEAIGRAFLANVHKELLALLPLEALQRLQTALQTDQFFALADPSPDDIRRFPQGKECIQAQLARPPCTGSVHPLGQHKAGGR